MIKKGCKVLCREEGCIYTTIIRASMQQIKWYQMHGRSHTYSRVVMLPTFNICYEEEDGM